MKNRIKELREQCGYTQKELGVLCGTSQSFIALIEQGKRSIDFDFAEILARALHCKVYELLPVDEQPEALSAEEKELLRLFRRSKKPDLEPVQGSVSKTG